jgi:uridylate kinase
VDGIYDSDPHKNKKAKRFSSISYLEVISKKLKVMDATAIFKVDEINNLKNKFINEENLEKI